MTPSDLLKCPQGHGPLTLVQGSGLSLHACAGCQGFALAQRDLRGLIEMSPQASPLARFREQSREQFHKESLNNAAPADLPCPRCDQVMDHFGYMGSARIQLQYCARCSLLWLRDDLFNEICGMYALTKARETQDLDGPWIKRTYRNNGSTLEGLKVMQPAEAEAADGDLSFLVSKLLTGETITRESLETAGKSEFASQRLDPIPMSGARKFSILGITLSTIIAIEVLNSPDASFPGPLISAAWNLIYHNPMLAGMGLCAVASASFAGIYLRNRKLEKLISRARMALKPYLVEMEEEVTGSRYHWTRRVVLGLPPDNEFTRKSAKARGRSKYRLSDGGLRGLEDSAMSFTLDARALMFYCLYLKDRTLVLHPGIMNEGHTETGFLVDLCNVANSFVVAYTERLSLFSAIDNAAPGSGRMARFRKEALDFLVLLERLSTVLEDIRIRAEVPWQAQEFIVQLQKLQEQLDNGRIEAGFSEISQIQGEEPGHSQSIEVHNP